MKRKILSYDDFMDNAKDYPTLTTWKKADDRWSKPVNWKETNEAEDKPDFYRITFEKGFNPEYMLKNYEQQSRIFGFYVLSSANDEYVVRFSKYKDFHFVRDVLSTKINHLETEKLNKHLEPFPEI